MSHRYSRAEKARLQDVEVLYAEDELQSPFTGEATGNGNQSIMGSGSSQRPRASATLRLGPASGSKRKASAVKPAPKKTTQARQIRRKPPASIKGTTRTRGIRSPLQGAKSTKVLATKAKPSALRTVHIMHLESNLTLDRRKGTLYVLL
ncbi:unnamed protein product [Eruca vesicaria subsp. sativa]|uniref:Uncharacterized protein n=1 Tax=Eruca vesicaria subsp. sativa TaxID=29727 RepID=A0ABC8JBL8_ERUVS|nr:unnamed protein product [Eruca vesicaria subsp. sativa]